MKKLLTILLVAFMVLAMTACGGNKPTDSSSDSSTAVEAVELTQDEYDSLMWQIADQEGDLQYREYMPDMRFAEAEIFGADKEGNKGTAYAMLCTDEFVVLKDKAYSIAGGQGEVIIKFEYTDDVPKLTEVIWSADGEDHESWLKDNFPADYLKKANNYQAYDADGKSVLDAKILKAAEKELGVPVETEDLLQIDLEAGTYEVSKVIESGEGESYKFDTEVVDSGKLADLK